MGSISTIITNKFYAKIFIYISVDEKN